MNSNIKEMVGSGHPQKQAVAAAMNKARADEELPHPMGEGGVETIKRAYNGEFAGGEEPEKPEKPEDDGMEEAASRFDTIRDQMQKLDKRIDAATKGEFITEQYDQMGNPIGKQRTYGSSKQDDCAATDDRSAAGHAEALAGLIASGKPHSAEATFHKAEAVRPDDDCAV